MTSQGDEMASNHGSRSTPQKPTGQPEPPRHAYRVRGDRTIMIEYPFPVEDGRAVALVRVPKYLSRADADRLISFVRTLVIEG
jgi:hypothetical protein